MKNNRLTLRKLEDKDITMLTNWLYKEYILKWYHDPEDWLTEINGRLGIYSWIHHFIVMNGDIPIGFCQYYDCYDANQIEDWYTVTQKNDTFSIDYLIGEESYLGMGYGKEIVKLLSETIQHKEQANCIIVQPEKENHSSNHVLIANGFLYDSDREYYYKRLNR